jgi:hypothetical protein
MFIGEYGDEEPYSKYTDATFVDDVLTYGTVTHNRLHLFQDIAYESYTGEFAMNKSYNVEFAMKNSEGCYSVPYGKGTMTFFDGDTYTGHFRCGSPCAIKWDSKKARCNRIGDFIDNNIIKNKPQTSRVGLNEIWLRYYATCRRDGATANKEELRDAMELRFNEMTKQNGWAGWKGIALNMNMC